MNEPTPAPAADVAAAPLAPSGLEDLAPSSAPLPAVPPPAASEDQLPTSRLQSLALELPPAMPPQGPAHKTQPLRPITREAAAQKLAAEKKYARRRRWQSVVAHMKRTALAVPSGFAGLRSTTWTARRAGFLFGALGLAMIACALVLGWQGIAADRFEKAQHVSLAVAALVARAAMAIATMVVGYGLLRVGERALASDASARLGRNHDDGEGQAS